MSGSHLSPSGKEQGLPSQNPPEYHWGKNVSGSMVQLDVWKCESMLIYITIPGLTALHPLHEWGNYLGLKHLQKYVYSSDKAGVIIWCSAKYWNRCTTLHVYWWHAGLVHCQNEGMQWKMYSEWQQQKLTFPRLQYSNKITIGMLCLQAAYNIQLTNWQLPSPAFLI